MDPQWTDRLSWKCSKEGIYTLRKYEGESHLFYLASTCPGLSYEFSQSPAIQIVWPGGPLWADFSFSWHWLPDGKGLGCQFMEKGICSHSWWPVTPVPISTRRCIRESSPMIRSQWQTVPPNWETGSNGSSCHGRQKSIGVQVLASDRRCMPALLLTSCEVMGVN